MRIDACRLRHSVITSYIVIRVSAADLGRGVIRRSGGGAANEGENGNGTEHDDDSGSWIEVRNSARGVVILTSRGVTPYLQIFKQTDQEV